MTRTHIDGAMVHGPPPSLSPSPKILIIDDNQDLSTLLERILKEKGYAVVCAKSGEEGLTIGQQWIPDIVLLDISLEDMWGYEVAQSFRSFSKQSIRLIAMSGHTLNDGLIRKAGFDWLMSKPFTLQELEVHLTVPNCSGSRSDIAKL